MSKQILIDSYFGLVRTAIAEGQVLMDYYEESPDQGRSKGNIYRGVVKKVDAPIQAAFVRFGAGRDGFLPLRDAGSGNKAPKVGDSVLVQVVKDEVGEKGAALTTKLSLSGRYLVYIPERESEGGISSRITDEERAALKQALGELQVPEGGSVILRTAAMNKGAAELQADLDRLTEAHREIADRFAQGKEPGLMFREVPPALRYLREYYTPDVERIWVNQEEVLNQCRQFFYLYEPKSAAKVVLSQDGPLMFQKLGLEADVEKLNSRKVALPSGANIVIDQAEALVAIDVNSAKAGGRGEDGRNRSGERGRSEEKGRTESSRGGSGSDLEETVFAVNKEAAGEIARQLRLRDLGGIIIVDFIDMEEERHRRQIEETMRKALAADKAKVKVYDISPLGIMQISRQRLRKAGPNFSRQGCEACAGRGWHPSPSAGALTVLRKMEERLHGKKAGQGLTVSAPYPVANKLLNEFREHVLSMERRFGCILRVTALPAPSGEAAIASHSAAEEGKARETPLPAARARPDGRQAEGRGREGRNPEGKGARGRAKRSAPRSEGAPGTGDPRTGTEAPPVPAAAFAGTGDREAYAEAGTHAEEARAREGSEPSSFPPGAHGPAVDGTEERAAREAGEASPEGPGPLPGGRGRRGRTRRNRQPDGNARGGKLPAPPAQSIKPPRVKAVEPRRAQPPVRTPQPPGSPQSQRLPQSARQPVRSAEGEAKGEPHRRRRRSRRGRPPEAKDSP
ncbi:MAG TPA: ribonuclease E/G [Fibrobacteria bacterium]|nr:ribonuclease E/G [Fibrobacteria bacterium]